MDNKIDLTLYQNYPNLEDAVDALMADHNIPESTAIKLLSELHDPGEYIFPDQDDYGTESMWCGVI